MDINDSMLFAFSLKSNRTGDLKPSAIIPVHFPNYSKLHFRSIYVPTYLPIILVVSIYLDTY